MAERGASRLLIEERVVVAQPTVVRRLGLTQAVVVQQLHWRFQECKRLEHEGHEWAPVTYADLARETGLSADQVRRAIESLEEAGVVVSCQAEGLVSRRKSYRVEIDHPLLLAGESARPSGASATSGSGEDAASSSSKTSKTSSASGAGASSKEKPRRRPQQRNPIYDALADVFPTSTKSEQQLCGMAAHEIERLRPVPDPQDVRAVARLVRQEWPDATPRAVASHWSRFLARHRGQGRAGPTASRDAFTRCRRCGYMAPMDCSCAEGPLA